jgi:hypothetical protein
MIQTILTLTIVGLAVAKTVYSLYKSITTKEKGLCGGCASCDLKNELKKKGKLGVHKKTTKPTTVLFTNAELKYVPKG